MAKVKILCLASNPLEQSRLALDEEIRAITSQIRSADYRDALELISAWAVRPDDLQQLLLQHKPHVVHFSGHGRGSTPTGATPPSTLTTGRDMTVSHIDRPEKLVLIGEGGKARPMSKAALVHVFSVLNDNIHLVLLSACHSEPIAEDLVEVIPCAIGMRGAITDEASVAFAAAFYRAIGFGRNIQEAFDLGKNALMNLHIPEDQAPRLYSRNGAVGPAQVVLVAPSIAPSRRAAAGADRNRLAMLEKVRKIWITGFLGQSLFQKSRILLGLSERTDIVARPLDLLVKRPDQGERPLPSDTQIVDVYDNMDEALLILGAPGAGKTTLLLELARDLLTRATDDLRHPIPVVFPLSTWSESRKPLLEWLVDELNMRYDVPSKIAHEWVATDQVMPLLDGLDEVKAGHRAACVEAINAFRRSHGLLPLVITSRMADYEALAEPLRLHAAILLRPLTRKQVNDYLAELGTAARPVRTALYQDPSLWELLDSPLLLYIVTVAYAGQQTLTCPAGGTVGERRDGVFRSYVNQMLRRRAAKGRYTREQTVHWLSWLASQMANRGYTDFYLERLQLDWFPKRPRWAIRVYYGLLYGLIYGLIYGMLWRLVVWTWGFDFFVVFVLVVGLLIGLIYGLVSMLDYNVSPFEIVRWSRLRFRFHIAFAGLVYGLVVGINAGLVSGLIGGLAVGLVGGLFAALIHGVTFSQIDTRSVPNEGIKRSARNALVVGLILGLFGLVGGLIFGLFAGDVDGLVKWLVFGLAVGLVAGLLGGLVAGGELCIKHFVIRLWLIHNGSIPWNYGKFLDDAAERILLRKVGGSYVFLHRMLLKYFAALYVEPAIETTAPANSTEVKDAL